MMLWRPLQVWKTTIWELSVQQSHVHGWQPLVGMKELKKCQDTSLEDDHMRTHRPTAPQISNGTFVFIHCWPLAWKSFRWSYLPIILNNHHQKRSSFQCNVETSWVGDFFAIIEWNSWSYLCSQYHAHNFLTNAFFIITWSITQLRRMKQLTQSFPYHHHPYHLQFIMIMTIPITQLRRWL